MIQGISAENSSSYGTIKRLGNNPNGRIMYSVFDKNGEETGKLSIAPKDSKKFEKAYKDITASASEIKTFVANHSAPEDLKKRKNTFRAIVTLCGVIGASVPLIYFRNSKSITKQIISSIIGIVSGIFAGFGIALAVNSPPGSLKFARASRTISKLDVKQI